MMALDKELLCGSSSRNNSWIKGSFLIITDNYKTGKV